MCTPYCAIVEGNPAVVKKYRFDKEHIARFLAVEWWRFAPWQLQGIDITRSESNLSALEKLCPTLEPYAPGYVWLKNFT
jgi:hypothetical protein